MKTLADGTLTYLEVLNRPADVCWRPYEFSNVVATWSNDFGVTGEIEIPGICSSEFASGPDLCHLSGAVNQMVCAHGPLWVGLKSCVKLN